MLQQQASVLYPKKISSDDHKHLFSLVPKPSKHPRSMHDIMQQLLIWCALQRIKHDKYKYMICAYSMFLL